MSEPTENDPVLDEAALRELAPMAHKMIDQVVKDGTLDIAGLLQLLATLEGKMELTQRQIRHTRDLSDAKLRLADLTIRRDLGQLRRI